ncbi:MAG: thioredoxin family protein [Desulfobacterales bacterium]|nr:thioredoxin family protein [Desulfobacterales bacterium]
MHGELKKKADVIRKWNEGLIHGVTLRLIRTDGSQSRVIERFIRDFSELAPGIAVKEEKGKDGDLPGIYIRESWRLHFVPEGTELDPFLDLLSAIDTGTEDIRDDIRETLKNHSAEVPLTLFLSTQCHNCPAVMRQIAPLPLVNPAIRVRVIDGLLFPDLASEHRIKAVPSLIGEGGIRWTGQIRLEEVIKALVSRDEERFDKGTIERMITEGDVAPLADMMIEAGRVFPAFPDVLTQELFSIRLGAMVIMEDLGERAPALARTALEPLWQKMPGSDESVQGDIIYLVGETGDIDWVPRLEAFLNLGVSPDLEDAVRDALDALTSK